MALQLRISTCLCPLCSIEVEVGLVSAVLLLTLAPVASAIEVTKETWDAKTAGKQALSRYAEQRERKRERERERERGERREKRAERREKREERREKREERREKREERREKREERREKREERREI